MMPTPSTLIWRITTDDRQAVRLGEVLREDGIPALGRYKTEIARFLGILRQTLYDLPGERQPITAPLALRIAEAEIADEIEAIPTLEVA